jgi:hypothetical protein
VDNQILVYKLPSLHGVFRAHPEHSCRRAESSQREKGRVSCFLLCMRLWCVTFFQFSFVPIPSEIIVVFFLFGTAAYADTFALCTQKCACRASQLVMCVFINFVKLFLWIYIFFGCVRPCMVIHHTPDPLPIHDSCRGRRVGGLHCVCFYSCVFVLHLSAFVCVCIPKPLEGRCAAVVQQQLPTYLLNLYLLYHVSLSLPNLFVTPHPLQPFSL